MKDSEKKRDQGSIYVGAGVAIGAALSVVRRKDVDPLD